MSPFCETFFTDVKVPKENLVGEEGQGWTIGKRLLQHERTNLSGGGSRLQMSGPSLADLAKKFVGEEDGKIADKRSARADRQVGNGLARVPAHRDARDGGIEGGRRGQRSVVDPQDRRHQARPGTLRTDHRDRGAAGARLGRRGVQRRRNSTRSAPGSSARRRRSTADRPRCRTTSSPSASSGCSTTNSMAVPRRKRGS